MSVIAVEAFTGVIGRWRDWQNGRAGLAELERCGQSEAGRIANDLSVTSGELRMLARHGADAASLLYRRMAALGLGKTDVARDEPKVMRDLQKACTLCESKDQCRRDFARGADFSAWQSYCPNDGTLQALMSRPVNAANHVLPVGKSAVATGVDQPHMHAWSWALLFVSCAWLILNTGFPAVNLHFNSNTAFNQSAENIGATPAAVVECLDERCLTAEQQTALRTLETVHAQGWVNSSVAQLRTLQRASRTAREVYAGEASTCSERGGTTYYGLMFQTWCSDGGSEAARHNGYNSCQPMTGGGVCLFK